MGRPLKEGLTYFQHDVDMSADEKLEALEAVHGNDGYAVYNKLLERIYKSFGKLDLSDDVQRLSIARKCNISSDKFQAVIDDAVRFRLFDRDAWETKKQLTSTRIRTQLDVVEEERERWRKKAGGDNPAQGELSPEKTPVIPGENPSYPLGKVHKGEERRGEEKRGEYTQKFARAEKSEPKPIPEPEDPWTTEPIAPPEVPGGYPRKVYEAWEAIGDAVLQPASYLHFVNSTWGKISPHFRGIHSDDVLKAISNFRMIATGPPGKYWWTRRIGIEGWAEKHVAKFLPANFREVDFLAENASEGTTMDDIERALAAGRAETAAKKARVRS